MMRGWMQWCGFEQRCNGREGVHTGISPCSNHLATPPNMGTSDRLSALKKTQSSGNFRLSNGPKNTQGGTETRRPVKIAEFFPARDHAGVDPKVTA